MRRLLTCCLAGTTMLVACGDSSRSPAGTRAAGPSTGAVARLPPPVTSAPAPSGTTGAVPQLKPPPALDARGAYLARLGTLAAKLGPAIDEAATSGDSTPIARIDTAVMRTTRRWLASGGAASPAAGALAAAIATARTNVESALLAPESLRQVRAAQATLAAERGAG